MFSIVLLDFSKQFSLPSEVRKNGDCTVHCKCWPIYYSFSICTAVVIHMCINFLSNFIVKGQAIWNLQYKIIPKCTSASRLTQFKESFHISLYIYSFCKSFIILTSIQLHIQTELYSYIKKRDIHLLLYKIFSLFVSCLYFDSWMA